MVRRWKPPMCPSKDEQITKCGPSLHRTLFGLKKEWNPDPYDSTGDTLLSEASQAPRTPGQGL